MANFPFVVGDSLRIGDATLSATGNVLSLPSGTQVGSTPVATTVEVSTGGGPKITNVQITDQSWTVLDDTAVDTAGGYFIITGTNFVTGCLVYIGQTPANSVGFVNTTTVRVTVPATAAGTYPVYLVNPDGGTAIRVPGINFSASPAWQTASSLGEQPEGQALTLSLVATLATAYTVTSGTLPPGLSLDANTGVISGTVTGVTVETTYTFTVRATDAELQDSPRTFTVTITVSDPYFKLTTLLLTGNSGTTVVTDSSTNNFPITVVGDSRATNFSPYLTGWSNYFDGTGDYLTVPDSTAFDLPGDFTLEGWFYFHNLSTNNSIFGHGSEAAAQNGFSFYWAASTVNKLRIWSNGSAILTGTRTLSTNIWYHIAIVRLGSGANNLILYVNGELDQTITVTTSFTGIAALGFGIGVNYDGSTFTSAFNGHASNIRLVKGTALYTANFTPATTTLTAVTNTSLLTCHANRLVDSSTNNFAITRNGDVRVTSFNPFNLTNIGTTGSMYFDGTGDFLTATPGSAIAYGLNPYTIEFWVNPSSLSVVGHLVAANANDGLVIYVNNAKVALNKYGIGDILAYNTALPTSAWSHVAVVREGTGTNQTKIYINGVAQVTGTDSTNWAVTSNFSIGGNSTGGSNQHLNGYMSDVRIVKGTAVYTSNFTPPTAPLTAITNTSLLTLQNRQPPNNHTFQDSSTNNFLITRNGNATQGTFSPFSQSGWSNYFDGSGDYLELADNDAWHFGSGNFTVEAWIYVTATNPGVGGTQQIVGQNYGTESQRSWTLAVNGSSNPLIGIYGEVCVGSTLYSVSTSSVSISLTTWNHIAFVRDGSTLKLFLNGTQVATGSVTGTANNAAQVLAIARNGFSGYEYYFYGYISSLRIVKGTAVYTSNFTPASSNLTAVTNTVLLTCQSNRFLDNSTNNFTITRYGDARVQAFSPFAATAVYSADTNKGSLYLDGSNDYLTLPSTNRLDIPANTAFTVEFWIYLISDGAQPFSTWAGAATNYDYHGGAHIYNPGFDFSNTSGSACRIVWYYGRYGAYAAGKYSSSTVPKRAWTHIAWCRDSSNGWHLFLNGVKQSLAVGINTGSPWSDGAAFPYGTNVWGIGDKSSGATDNYYLYGLKYIVGQALYTGANLTVPTSPTTSSAGTNLLCEFVAPAIADATGRNVIETVADARTTSVVTKWAGSHSMSFDGTGDYLYTNSNLQYFVFGTGDFTVETWLFATATPTNFACIFDTRPASTQGVYTLLYLNSDLTINLWVSSANRITSSAIATNTWYHVALSRASSNTRLFINGVQSGSTYADTNSYLAPLFLIGGSYSGGTSISNSWAGYMQDLRITRYARYTANFTPPTGAHRLK